MQSLVPVFFLHRAPNQARGFYLVPTLVWAPFHCGVKPTLLELEGCVLFGCFLIRLLSHSNSFCPQGLDLDLHHLKQTQNTPSHAVVSTACCPPFARCNFVQVDTASWTLAFYLPGWLDGWSSFFELADFASAIFPQRGPPC